MIAMYSALGQRSSIYVYKGEFVYIYIYIIYNFIDKLTFHVWGSLWLAPSIGNGYVPNTTHAELYEHGMLFQKLTDSTTNH